MIFDSKIEINKMETVPRYDIVDSHLHFLDFTQDSDGLEALLEAMDASGVSEADHDGGSADPRRASAA